MIYRFNFGFIRNGVPYGWYKKELYRLPFERKGRAYSFKKLDQIMVGNNPGYRVAGQKKTIDQLKELTHTVDWSYSVIKNNNTPF